MILKYWKKTHNFIAGKYNFKLSQRIIQVLGSWCLFLLWKHLFPLWTIRQTGKKKKLFLHTLLRITSLRIKWPRSWSNKPRHDPCTICSTLANFLNELFTVQLQNNLGQVKKHKEQIFVKLKGFLLWIWEINFTESDLSLIQHVWLTRGLSDYNYGPLYCIKSLGTFSDCDSMELFLGSSWIFHAIAIFLKIKFVFDHRLEIIVQQNFQRQLN